MTTRSESDKATYRDQWNVSAEGWNRWWRVFEDGGGRVASSDLGEVVATFGWSLASRATLIGVGLSALAFGLGWCAWEYRDYGSVSAGAIVLFVLGGLYRDVSAQLLLLLSVPILLLPVSMSLSSREVGRNQSRMFRQSLLAPLIRIAFLRSEVWMNGVCLQRSEKFRMKPRKFCVIQVCSLVR